MPITDPQAPRRTLSLPGLAPRPADASPLAACATGATADGHQVPANVPAVLARPEGHDARLMSRQYLAQMLADLAAITGAAAPAAFEPRIPLPLKHDIDADLAARFPDASPEAIASWLKRWCGSSQYRLALAGAARFDLDGVAVVETVTRINVYGAPEQFDARLLSRPYLTRMLVELAGILRAPVPPVFAPRAPLPLRVGIFADLMTAAAGNADQLALRRWLVRWCSTDQYRKALADGGWRFDLAGNAVEEISAEASAHAAERLAKEAGR